MDYWGQSPAGWQKTHQRFHKMLNYKLPLQALQSLIKYEKKNREKYFIPVQTLPFLQLQKLVSLEVVLYYGKAASPND